VATTFETYAGQRAGNYSTLPRVDVEILPDEHHCQTCGNRVVYDPNAGTFGGWVHVECEQTDDGHRAVARLRCRYCHTEDGVTFTHAAYSDETHCTRCGGVDGFAIGD